MLSLVAFSFLKGKKNSSSRKRRGERGGRERGGGREGEEGRDEYLYASNCSFNSCKATLVVGVVF